MSTSAEVQSRFQRAFVPTTALAKSVDFAGGMMHVQLTDGRIVSVPLAWFPLLRDATPQQREHFEVGGGGVSLHWPDIDEDISVAGLMAGADQRSM
jgi:hypothetical protein